MNQNLALLATVFESAVQEHWNAKKANGIILTFRQKSFLKHDYSAE
jgi:hypothetical protein